MSKHPEFRTEMASTDMRIMNKLSNVWCGWQEISSSHPVTVYRLNGEPTIRKNRNIFHRLNFTKKLHFGKENQLQYFFLSDSRVDITACTNKDGIFLRIFKGIQKWKNCLKLRKTHPFQTEDSSSEESEEDEGYGHYSNKFWENYRKKSLKKMIQRWYPPCEDYKSFQIPYGAKACEFTTLSFTVNEEDSYVFSLEDYHPASDESQTSIYLSLNRTIYDVYENSPVCKDALKCEVSLSFGSNERAVIKIEPESNAGAISYMVISTCKPRIIFFLLLFVLIPVSVLLCVGCTVMLCKKSKERNMIKYIEITRENMDRTPPKVPLLAGPEVTIYSRPNIQVTPPSPPTLSSSPPPSYSQCSTPPSYTFVTSLQDGKKI